MLKIICLSRYRIVNIKKNNDNKTIINSFNNLIIMFTKTL